MKKLAIFDLDGTLVSSIDDITRCVNEAFEYFNIPSITKDQCMKSLGHGARSLVISSLEYSGYTPSSDAEQEDIINKYNEIYGLCDQAATKPFDGIMQMLKNIRKMLRRHALAGIADCQNHIIFFLSHGHRHPSARRRMTQRIGKQIINNLVHALFIQTYGRHFCCFSLQQHLLFLG